ncbi:hypothetical protein V6N12_048736 [Hibiscus sabdariffa]|uniref:Uncharacterized protein n=1 Tax=Hibiscus sabdariffa TaxID=183260 RepID=A0ABR2EI48_9ROSI
MDVISIGIWAEVGHLVDYEMVVPSPAIGVEDGYSVENDVDVAPTEIGAEDVGSDSTNQHEEGMMHMVEPNEIASSIPNLVNRLSNTHYMVTRSKHAQWKELVQ